MATLVKKNFCIAPFTQLTFDPWGSFSPCPEIGGVPWKETSADPVKMWSSEDFELLRKSFLNNEKNPVCNRCWTQEDHKNQSLRKRLIANGTKGFKAQEIDRFLTTGYKVGPSQINLIVGNKCNLRCRICNAQASVTYNVEGQHYEKKNNLTGTDYTIDNPKAVGFTDRQIDQIFELSGNLQRLEYYGGEPLMDLPTLTLLQKFVDSGQSKNITLFYNTNGTVPPSKKHFDLWDKFNKIEFNISLDDIGDRFTYNRHPGNWDEVLENINVLRSHEWTVPVDFYVISTVSNLNIFYIPELLNELEHMNLPWFLNTLDHPNYYAIVNLPVAVKSKVIEKLKTYKDVSKIQFLINMLENPEDLSCWEKFKFWTREKDTYRKESFAKTYPEFYAILKEYDDLL
jgi:MoaA/NifB/PqqE/SkfB family radical SAM enzyme